MRNILIHGFDTLLGSYFAAAVLMSSNDLVFYQPSPGRNLSEEGAKAILTHAFGQLSGKTSADETSAVLGGQLRTISYRSDFTVSESDSDVRIDEVWYFAHAAQRTKAHRNPINELPSALLKLGATEFNYVRPLTVVGTGTAGAEEDQLAQAAERDVVLACEAYGLKYRIFRTSLVLGVGHPTLRPGQGDFLQFLTALHSLKSEIEERWPQYFDFRALRYWAAEGASINLIDARVAAKLLLQIARNAGAFGVTYPVCSPENFSLKQVFNRVEEIYGLGLLTAGDRFELNAIDRNFNARLAGFQPCFAATVERDWSETYRTAGYPAQSGILDAETQIHIFQENCRSQDAAREARSQQLADLNARLTRKTLVRNGFALSYYVGGTVGPVVVLLNALGQGLRYWYRLMDLLMERYRVIIWEPRGTVSPPPPFGLDQQVMDLESILRNEDVDWCYFIAWCTGPKVAVDFCVQRPAVVRSMVFLNSNFKCVGREELDTPYAQALDALCRSVVRKPAMAASVMQSLQSMTAESEVVPQPGIDGGQLSTRVISLINTDLRSDVMAPFRNEETTINYAHQLLEFATHDSKRSAARVTAPVLLIASEYDQVASPAMSNAAAQWFPNAQLVHVEGATHYCLYDRPDFIMELIVDFFQNTEELPAAHSLETEMAAVR